MLSTTIGLKAQTLPQYIEAAEKYYEYGDFANAAYLFAEALEFDTTNHHLRFRRGESNLHYRAYERALVDFAKIEKSDSSSNFPRLPYLQAKAAQPLGRYDFASDHFSRFLTNPGNASEEEIEDAERQLSNTKWAKEMVAIYRGAISAGNQDNAFPIHYTNVNTRYDDFSPFFASDQFYFSSLRYRMEKDTINPRRKIAHVLQRKAEGIEAINRQLPEPINQKNQTTAHSAFNTAGTMVYFTYCEYVTDTLSLRCDLYAATVSESGEWGTPQKLAINADGANNTHPNVGMHPDGSEYLYFASDRSGGQGMHDLYRSLIGTEGSLGSPEPLSGLNTPFDDVTPFYYAPQRELYFSTDGRNTLGGLDIYRSSSMDTEWMEPVHMGLPTNSSYNDVYYSRFEEHDFAYFASNRHTAEAIFWDEDEDVCCNDIYKVEIERICFEVTTWHALTKAELNATTVTFYEELPNGERVALAQETHPDNNFYTFEVEKGRKYGVTAVKRGFKGDQTIVDMSLPSEAKTYSDDCIKAELYLPPPTIRLEVVTLNKVDRTELDGCTVSLLSGSSDTSPLQEDARDTKPDSHLYTYDIVLERYYEIFGSKPDYTSDSAFVDTRGLFVENDTVIKRELLLEPILPCDIQPTVFFHNDIPVKGTPHTTTPANYIDTYTKYKTLEPTYLSKWGTTTARETSMEAYFKEVDKGVKDLEAYAEMLEEYLSKGGKLTVSLQGFASPRAKGPYNDQLSARRCMSVIRYFWNYKGGVLKKHMQNADILMFNEKNYGVPGPFEGVISIRDYGGDKPKPTSKKSLIFDIKPGGEVPVDPSIGLVDTGAASIYSPVAAAARYVEIKVEGCEKPPTNDAYKPNQQEY